MTEQTSNLYVLLIGIDYYNPNRLYKSLKGAVRDINLVDTYLQQAVPPKRTWKLISPNPEVVDPAEVAAAQAHLPTYDNIVQAFKEITETAQSGELVYIHYSGHGGRATTIYPDLKGDGQNDEGIVPMDIGDREGRYLRDVEITTLLKRMTDKGLLVTVILDSCHSGGATRGDAEIRSSELGTDTTPRSAESLVAEREELANNWRMLTEKTEARVAGLPTREYVLLAACRPNEYAYEYAVEGQDRHGALTYWMINTLTSSASSGQRLTYKLLHDRINAQIQSKFQNQLPMIMGESDRLVFGKDRWSTPYTVSVMTANPDRAQVTLNAGMAQGLSRGTRFAIYPLHTTDFTDKQKQVVIVEVTQVEAAGATARFVKPEEGGVEVKQAIEPGSPAVMTSAPVDLVRRVQLIDQKQQGDKEHELPPELVARQKEAIEAVRQALVGNGWVIEVQGGEQASHYQVAVGRNREYEISIETPITNLRPPLMIDDPEAAQGVVKRLVHLAKYQAVQSLANSGSRLADVLEVQLLTEEEKPFDTETPTIYAGDIVCLRITNKGSQPLKVAVLDLDPTWAISQLALDGLDAPFYDLNKGQTQDVKLRLSLPDSAEYAEATESFKIFAIQKGLADFRWLTLPSLDEQLEARGGALNEDLKGMMRSAATRGDEEAEGENPLNHLLSTIGADLEKAPNATRAAAVVLDPKQEWVTNQVQVLVKQ